MLNSRPMKTRKKNPAQDTGLHVQRRFSEAFKRRCVEDLERGLLSVTEAARLYELSPQSIYRWLHTYSAVLTHHARVVVELESEEHRTHALLRRVAELERIIGQKQVAIDVLSTIVAQAEEELGPEWKKKVTPASSNTSIWHELPSATR
jgi:transposase